MAYTSRMPDNPLRRMQEITPSDATVYDPPLILVRCGGVGNLQVKDLEGNIVLISSVIAGDQIPGPFSMVMATNTTATLITGWKNE